MFLFANEFSQHQHILISKIWQKNAGTIRLLENHRIFIFFF